MDEAIDTFMREGHSRIPVYKETIDEIVGVLYAKDLLPFLKGGDEAADLRKLLRAPLFVPESMSIDDLLHQLQGRKVHLAIVLDEYGGTAGMVTIEDLLEEIVGEIQDEYDVGGAAGRSGSRTTRRASTAGPAWTTWPSCSTWISASSRTRDEYDTVGGLIYHRIGGVPRPGDRVELLEQSLTLTVEVTDGHRVGKVLAVRRRAGDREGEEDRTEDESTRGAAPLGSRPSGRSWQDGRRPGLHWLRRHQSAALLVLLVLLVVATWSALWIVYDYRSPVSQFLRAYGTAQIDGWSTSELDAACIRLEPASGTPQAGADAALGGRRARPTPKATSGRSFWSRSATPATAPIRGWHGRCRWPGPTSSYAPRRTPGEPRPRAVVLVDAATGKLIVSHAEGLP